MYGQKINKKVVLIKNNEDVILGLYGAGEITGGVHGGNRLGGITLIQCFIFGRITAKNSVDYINNLI